jgi:serine/threonine protein kinase
MTDPIEQLQDTCLADRFDLEAFVARGGYGVVYRGTHRALGCPVAVKVLAVPEVYQGSARERFVEAFEKEARTVAALRASAIVRVLDFGVATVGDLPYPYMVLEWLDGATLEATLRERPGRRSPREALGLLRPVFDAIATAHEAGVAHRDIKPANVMVGHPRRGEVTTKVLDFGVAKVMRRDESAGAGVTRTSDELSSFSLSHAAPEQIGGLRTGPWTDVHALALLLVEVLAGERALRGADSVALFASITARERPTPGAFSIDVGPWEPVLARALALSPADRHPDAAALLAELDAGLDAAQRAWEVGERGARQQTRRRSPWVALVAAACLASVLARALVRRDARHPANHRLPVAASAPPAGEPHRVPETAPVLTPPPAQPLTAPLPPAARVGSTVLRSAPPRERRATPRAATRRVAFDDEFPIE